MRISVVVPVYNAEKYLEACVHSILRQTFSDFEVILIDDGSVDASGKLCDKLSGMDCRIRVAHQQNAGVTCARAKGVTLAHGEWICFVDSDDTLPIDSLERLSEGICDKTDIIVGFWDERKILSIRWLDLKKYREMCITGKGIYPGPCARLIRRRLFNEHTFSIPRTIVKGEDMLMNIRLSFATLQDVRIVPFKVYNYLSHPESCVHNFTPTCDYESIFYKEKLCAIPQSEQILYKKYCIKNGLKALHRIIRYSSSIEAWDNSLFVAQLKKDIIDSHYRLSLGDYFLIMSTNRFLKIILWKLF